MWLSRRAVLSAVGAGAALSAATSFEVATEDTPLPLGRFMLLRIVTEAGRCSPAGRGEPVGVRVPGGGSFERAECTRSSIFCMRPRRALI